MKDIGIIGSSDGPTSIYVSSKSEDFWKSGGIVEENNFERNSDDSGIGNGEAETAEVSRENLSEIVIEDDINARLDSRTLTENLEDGIKIMGIGMVAVFGVLTILYAVIKIMARFAKKKDSGDEKN